MSGLFPIREPGFLWGVLLVAGLSVAAWVLAETPLLQELRLSPLIVGIVLGATLGNTIREKIPSRWNVGITYCAKILLRLAIILFGFRITFADVAAVGLAGLAVDVIMVSTTLGFGVWAGSKILGLDKETAILTSIGAAICGAAAVVAAEPVVKAEPHKTAMAVATVVVFGTVSMILYPMAFRLGWVPGMDEAMFATFIGSTVHEVAHVAGAGAGVSDAVASTSMIVKMARVMLLAPALIVIGWALTRISGGPRRHSKLAIPWFAVGFIGVAGLNSFEWLAPETLAWITAFDTFLLTMAMTALGLDTNASKFKGVGLKPIYLAFGLFLWLVLGGYGVNRLLIGS